MTLTEFTSLCAERHSCRAYQPQAPDSEIVDRILECVRMAPSACNRQPWRFLIIGPDSAMREAVTAVYDREWYAKAPIHIVACGLHDQAWHRPTDSKDHTDVDVAIAVEHLCLAAAAAGLGTCWVCNFDAAALSAALGLDGNTEPVAIIPMGFPADGAAPSKKRKDMEEIAAWL